jgi:NAD(P)-dependent dehydrogenase (short-subunit alcohol dehydrogenase family)
VMLQDRVCLITGGAGGIGRVIALTFAKPGADVVGVDKRDAEKEAVADEARGLGSKALPIVADVSKPSDVERLVQDSLRESGRIDVFVNNAGIWRPIPVMDIPLLICLPQNGDVPCSVGYFVS